MHQGYSLCKQLECRVKLCLHLYGKFDAVSSVLCMWVALCEPTKLKDVGAIIAHFLQSVREVRFQGEHLLCGILQGTIHACHFDL